jgi:GxxExxY protein
MTEAQLNALSKKIIGAAIDVHRELGPGLDELDYEQALSLSLTKAGIANERQAPLPIIYKAQQLDCGYRLDILVESALVLELKSVAAVLPILEAQLLTYLRLSGHQLGLLANFNVVLLKDGTPLIEAQFRSKLRLGGWSDGLLMNFNAPTIEDGLRRLGIALRRF